jgi:hypothetical protein
MANAVLAHLPYFITEVHLVDVNVIGTSAKDFMDLLTRRHFALHISLFINDDTFKAFLFCKSNTHNFNFLLSQFIQ